MENKDEKVIYDLYIDGKKQTKRISTKILKMDENNQYGQAMTKALLYGCIKKQDHLEFYYNKILDNISHDDKTGHLFVVDIKFYDKTLKLYCSMKSIHPSLQKIKRWNLLKDQHYN